MIYLVRHGESTWNREHRLQGQTHAPPLTSLGRQQAAAARTLINADLRKSSVDAFVTSDLERARQTAAVLAGDRPVHLDARLRERHAGRLQGLTSQDAMAELGSFAWSDPDAALGGGESARQVHERVGAVLTEYRGGTAVLVSHGDTIRTALGWWCGYEPGAEPWVTVASAAIFVLTAPGEYHLIAGTFPPA